MIFPLLLILFAALAAVGYFARKGITYTSSKGTEGSFGMALVAMVIIGCIGWGLDAWTGWSVIPQYMYAIGGTLQIIAVMFFATFAALILSMLFTASKVGQLVA